ncbi:MAG TPA: 6,7-dimethyl-8-ribityllumazine synthase [Pirellulales bacterium]|jgi:6,7-dimethyl-8-ribityllumazine synthase|nr:6,7-dimethyl-8-ribityllumazine synthase [Pirellulales bacterium]
MVLEFEGRLVPLPGRFGVVVARYNETITRRLLAGAIETLAAHGVAEDDIEVAWVPGAFEIPLVAARMAKSRRYVAVMCLGAVIRGETTHDQHINTAVSEQLAAMGVQWQVPVMFGVLTCNSLEQAIQRAGGSVGNKGSECAEAALRMADLLNQLPG